MTKAVLSLHLLAVCAAIGGALAQAMLLGRARSGDPELARSLRVAALVPTRLLEAPGMAVALVSGAWLHHLGGQPIGAAFALKMLAVAWLAIAAVLEVKAVGGIAETAAATDGSELERRRGLERQLDGMGKLSALAVIVVIVASVNLRA
ncbi:MAG: DUF2269 family protein [Deltaproteobacteria bacterium]|nr:DUF2269 family protein [Deltaproteobacteria bacterium]